MRDVILNIILLSAAVLLLFGLVGCHGLQGKSVDATYETGGLGIVSGYGVVNFGYLKVTYHSEPTNAPAQ